MVGAASNSVVERGRKAGLEERGANPETTVVKSRAMKARSLVIVVAVVNCVRTMSGSGATSEVVILIMVE
jgi:hypothetical protein